MAEGAPKIAQRIRHWSAGTRGERQQREDTRSETRDAASHETRTPLYISPRQEAVADNLAKQMGVIQMRQLQQTFGDHREEYAKFLGYEGSLHHNDLMDEYRAREIAYKESLNYVNRKYKTDLTATAAHRILGISEKDLNSALAVPGLGALREYNETGKMPGEAIRDNIVDNVREIAGTVEDVAKFITRTSLAAVDALDRAEYNNRVNEAQRRAEEAREEASKQSRTVVDRLVDKIERGEDLSTEDRAELDKFNRERELEQERIPDTERDNIDEFTPEPASSPEEPLSNEEIQRELDAIDALTPEEVDERHNREIEHGLTPEDIAELEDPSSFDAIQRELQEVDEMDADAVDAVYQHEIEDPKHPGSSPDYDARLHNKDVIFDRMAEFEERKREQRERVEQWRQERRGTDGRDEDREGRDEDKENGKQVVPPDHPVADERESGTDERGQQDPGKERETTHYASQRQDPPDHDDKHDQPGDREDDQRDDQQRTPQGPDTPQHPDQEQHTDGEQRAAKDPDDDKKLATVHDIHEKQAHEEEPEHHADREQPVEDHPEHDDQAAGTSEDQARNVHGYNAQEDVTLPEVPRYTELPPDTDYGKKYPDKLLDETDRLSGSDDPVDQERARQLLRDYEETGEVPKPEPPEQPEPPEPETPEQPEGPDTLF